jgi:hypothetical protein
MFQENKDFIFKGVFAVARRIFLSGVIISATGVSLFAQTNPTMRQIDSLWRAFYGSPVHQGVVVFNKMAGGTTAAGDTSKDTVCIMRLTSGGGTATVKPLFRFTQCQVSGLDPKQWGVASGYAISKDGSRIAAQNCSGVFVSDSSGAHFKNISTTALGTTDNIALCFDDSTYNGTTIHRVVYAARNWLILRTTISDTNTGVNNDTLWKLSTSDSCYSRLPRNGGYSSVNKFGRYLSMQIGTGADIPMIVDLKTKQHQLPTTCTEDGCAVRLCKDSTGTVCFHQWSHRIPTTLWKWGTPGMSNIGGLPCLVDPVNCLLSNGDPGQGGENWCENDTNYMIQVGDNDVQSSPGCYSKAFIRRGKTTNPPVAMYLGDYFGWPNLWIDPAPSAGVMYNRAETPGSSPRITIRISGNELTLWSPEGRTLDNATLVNLKGMVIARGEKTSSDRQHFTIASLPRGICLLSWRESNVMMARFITITR